MKDTEWEDSKIPVLFYLLIVKKILLSPHFKTYMVYI